MQKRSEEIYSIFILHLPSIFGAVDLFVVRYIQKYSNKFMRESDVEMSGYIHAGHGMKG